MQDQFENHPEICAPHQKLVVKSPTIYMPLRFLYPNWGQDFFTIQAVEKTISQLQVLVWTAFQNASGGPGPKNASACGAKDGYLDWR